MMVGRLPMAFYTSHRSRRPRRAGVSFGAIVFVLLLLSGLGGGVWYFMSRANSGPTFNPLLAVAQVKPFEAKVLEQGQVESSENVEFRCEIKSRYGETRVIQVIPEGTSVRPGDILVQLDKSRLEEARETQEIAVATAEKLVQQANGALQAAEIAKIEYLEGKYEETKATILNEIFVAEEELRKAEEYARFSERLAAKSFVTELQLEADLFAVDRYRNQLDLARQKLRVLENQTKPKEIIAFDSEILASQAELSSAEKARDLEVLALQDVMDQLDKCTIRVPEGMSGQVVYANIFSSRGGSEWVLEEGATVRERQVLLRLPNLNKMQVLAKVNEAQIARVKEGLPVEVKIDAMPQADPLEGRVVKVNPYAEPESWSSGGVRRYGVFVELLATPQGLRPGMNASVSIETMYEPSVLQVPVQALAEQQGIYYVAVKNGETFETRVVELAAANAESAWITSGIKEGESVVMGPRAYEGLLNLPPMIEDKEGSRRRGPGAGGAGPGGMGQGGGPPGGRRGGPGAGGPGAGGPGAGGPTSGGPGAGGPGGGAAASGAGPAAGGESAGQGGPAGRSESAPASGGGEQGSSEQRSAPAGGGGFRPPASGSGQ